MFGTFWNKFGTSNAKIPKLCQQIFFGAKKTLKWQVLGDASQNITKSSPTNDTSGEKVIEITSLGWRFLEHNEKFTKKWFWGRKSSKSSGNRQKVGPRSMTRQHDTTTRHDDEDSKSSRLHVNAPRDKISREGMPLTPTFLNTICISEHHVDP